jgi:hypothetical protein
MSRRAIETGADATSLVAKLRELEARQKAIVREVAKGLPSAARIRTLKLTCSFP